MLTHHAREPVEMAGGTTFHFVTDGIEAALDKARAAAADQNVKIGGGVSTVRQYQEIVATLQRVLRPVFPAGPPAEPLPRTA